LINIIEQCVVLANDPVINMETLPQKIRDMKKNVSQSHMMKRDTNTAGIQLEKQVESLEKDLIVSALKEVKGNKTQAAKLLNISFRSLRYRLQKLGMDDDEDN
jgi:two-component system response regulator PilR (NtrC family)